MTVHELLSAVPVLPVLTIRDIDHAVPLARALVAGGLDRLEITLRTPVALDAIRRIADEVPEAIVGSGTVTRAEDLEATVRAGGRFAVSPGLTPALYDAARDSEIPLIPGVATPSEAMTARDAGFEVLKLFPAEAVGGRSLLRAVGGPLPDLRFCPTGGINESTFRDYLALENVVCVGGSWVAPRDAVESGDWPRITALAAACGSS